METGCGYGYEPDRLFSVALTRIFMVRAVTPDTAASAVLFPRYSLSLRNGIPGNLHGNTEKTTLPGAPAGFSVAVRVTPTSSP